MKTIEIQNRCQECVYFKDERHPAKTDVCNNLNVKGLTPAPRCFSIQPLHFVRSKVDIGKLGKALKDLNHSQMLTLANQLANAVLLSEYGIKFGQPVYFNMANQAYVDNFYKGYAVGVRTIETKTGKQTLIVVASALEFSEDEDGTYADRAMLSISPDQLLTGKEWKRKLAEMVEAGRLEQPTPTNERRLTYTQWTKAGKPIKPVYDIEYTPPTLDDSDVLSYWDDLDTNESIELTSSEDVREMLGTQPRAETGERLEYETYTDSDGNVIKTLKSTSTVHEEPQTVGIGFETQVVRC